MRPALRSRFGRWGLARKLVVASRHRGLTDADVFVASYPRSGNTWVRFLLADLITGRTVDFEGVEKVIPNVGFHSSAPEVLSDGGRLIKTHEPYRGAYQRAIYLIRDVRDVVVSWYRVTRLAPGPPEELDRFVAKFVSRRAKPYGAWQNHLHSWLDARRQGVDILLVRFEDLREDPVGTLLRIAAFIGVDTTRDRAAEVVRRNSALALRGRESANIEFLERTFGRRVAGVTDGSSGLWRDILTARHLQELEPALRLNRELGYDDDGAPGRRATSATEKNG